MAVFIDSSIGGFEHSLSKMLETTIETKHFVAERVEAIIEDVKIRKDEALLEYTNSLDRANFTIEELSVTADEIQTAYDSCDKEIISALQMAEKRIESYHKLQMPEDKRYTDDLGVELGWKWTPIDAVGLYVPGGLASYPSSVLMNAVPAKIAGVPRIAMVVPAPDGVLNPLVLAAAKIAGITEIYKVGGAQAVAALAYGTKTINPVDKIVGPGNAYVAAAKRYVFGKVGIDMIAGPSEIMVVADNKNDPKWIAADLLSQAEHDKDARPILVTDDEDFAKSVAREVENTLTQLDREDIARESWEVHGIIITVKDFDEAANVANIIAPEHVELAVDNADELQKKIRNAGAIFIGRYTPEALGDYVAGPSHVLPTSGSARFSSGLSVFDFIKRSSIISCSEDAFAKLSRPTSLIAKEEGLDAHALSVDIRCG